jgi:hypothetical protein
VPVTLNIIILSYVRSHAHLSFWVYLYAYSKILHRDIYEKLSISTYSMYGHIPKVYNITDGLVWSYTPRTYLSLDQIRFASCDTYVEVAISACRMDFSYIWWVLSALACNYCHHQYTTVYMSAYLFITLRVCSDPGV